MPRLPLLPEQPDDPEAAKIFEWVRDQGVALPALYRLAGHAPPLLQGWIDFAWALRFKATTPRRLRELMIMRGAQILGVAYEWAHHWPMAIEAGVAEEKLRGLATWETSDLYDTRERLALRLADEVAGGTGASEELMAALRTEFGEAETIELVLTASFYVCVSRFLSSTALELEPEYKKYIDESFSPY